MISENDEVCSTIGSFSATSKEGPGVTDGPDLEDCDVDDAADLITYFFDEDVDEDALTIDGGDFYTFDQEADTTNGDAGEPDVDGNSVDLLKGSSIDYVDTLMGAGFTVNNPNAVAACGCGSSFRTADDAGTARACAH